MPEESQKELNNQEKREQTPEKKEEKQYYIPTDYVYGIPGRKYVCPVCGKEFVIKRKGQKFCSKECANKMLAEVFSKKAQEALRENYYGRKRPVYRRLLQAVQYFMEFLKNPELTDKEIALRINLSPKTLKQIKKTQEFEMVKEEMMKHLPSLGDIFGEVKKVLYQDKNLPAKLKAATTFLRLYGFDLSSSRKSPPTPSKKTSISFTLNFKQPK